MFAEPDGLGVLVVGAALATHGHAVVVEVFAVGLSVGVVGLISCPGRGSAARIGVGRVRLEV